MMIAAVPFPAGGALEHVLCDTTYSDPAAPDGRGAAAAAVEVEFTAHQSAADGAAEGRADGDSDASDSRGGVSSRLRLRGTLRDGAPFDFSLPARRAGTAAGEGDRFVGRVTVDGRWVKARRSDGLYHLSAVKPGGRTVDYSHETREALARVLCAEHFTAADGQ
jgi:hypothetical protein